MQLLGVTQQQQQTLTNSTTSTSLLPSGLEGFRNNLDISKVRRKNQIPEIFLFPANFSNICPR